MKSKKCQMVIMIALMGIFVSGGILFVVQQEEKLRHSETVNDVAPLSSEEPVCGDESTVFQFSPYFQRS